MSGVSEAQPANEKVFEDELQLDFNMKRMIKALVKNHSNKDNTNADLIEGKGRSLVILLHGKLDHLLVVWKGYLYSQVLLVLAKLHVSPLFSKSHL